MRSVLILLTVIISVALISCTGKEGPVGPPGPGSRITYQSATPIATMDEWTLSIPEITLDDMPAISVYGALDEFPNEWSELPLYSPIYYYNSYYWLTEGTLHVMNCQGWWIKIVIVK